MDFVDLVMDVLDLGRYLFVRGLVKYVWFIFFKFINEDRKFRNIMRD